MENKGYVLAFFQKNPKEKSQIKAILSCEEDKLIIQIGKNKKVYKGNLLFSQDNLPVIAKGNQYLKLLSFIATLSQITFVYTEDFDMVIEYLNNFEE